MRITIFGANGKVGRLAVSDALERGHDVVAFIHNSSDLPENAKLKLAKGDIYDSGSVAEAIKGADVVISALGSWGTPKKDVLKAGMSNIIPAMEELGVKRIVTLTGHGANAPGDKFDPVHEFSRLILKVLASKILSDGEDHIKALNDSNLDWTAVRSPVMIQHVNPLKYRLRTRRPLPLAVIHRQAVANCMLDLAETGEYARQAPFVVRK